MRTTAFTRITTGLVATAALGGLALGLTGTANAEVHPITGAHTHFTVFNDTHQTIYFDGYEDMHIAKEGPLYSAAIKPGNMAGFDIDTWAIPGFPVKATFDSEDGHKHWTVEMRSSLNNGNEVNCRTNAGCSTFNWTSASHASLT